MTETSTTTPTEACSGAPQGDPQCLLHGCLLGNQIDLHRSLPPGCPRGATWELEREWENEVRQPELEAPLTK